MNLSRLASDLWPYLMRRVSEQIANQARNSPYGPGMRYVPLFGDLVGLIGASATSAPTIYTISPSEIGAGLGAKVYHVRVVARWQDTADGTGTVYVSPNGASTSIVQCMVTNEGHVAWVDNNGFVNGDSLGRFQVCITGASCRNYAVYVFGYIA